MRPAQGWPQEIYLDFYSPSSTLLCRLRFIHYSSVYVDVARHVDGGPALRNLAVVARRVCAVLEP